MRKKCVKNRLGWVVLAAVAACSTAWLATADLARASPTRVPPAQATPKPSAISATDWPRDAAGRPFGGHMPYLNYRSTMVTGKPCKRISAFKVDAKGRVSNPCVIQNLIDDYMQGAYAEWNVNTKAEITALAEHFPTDPVLSRAFSAIYIEIGVKQQGYLRASSLECAPALYRLLVGVDRTLRLFDEGGTTKALLQFVRVSKNMQPYTCQTHAVMGDKVKPLPPVTAQDLAGARAARIYQVELAYNPELAAWQIIGIKSTSDQYLSGAQLKALYEAAPYQP